MGGPIGVDLERAQECKAGEMIKFLLAFCTAGGGKVDLVHDEEVLGRAYEKAREIANEEGLKAHLSEL